MRYGLTIWLDQPLAATSGASIPPIRSRLVTCRRPLSHSPAACLLQRLLLLLLLLFLVAGG